MQNILSSRRFIFAERIVSSEHLSTVIMGDSGIVIAVVDEAYCAMARA